MIFQSGKGERKKIRCLECGVYIFCLCIWCHWHLHAIHVLTFIISHVKTLMTACQCLHGRKVAVAAWPAYSIDVKTKTYKSDAIFYFSAENRICKTLAVLCTFYAIQFCPKFSDSKCFTYTAHKHKVYLSIHRRLQRTYSFRMLNTSAHVARKSHSNMPSSSATKIPSSP